MVLVKKRKKQLERKNNMNKLKILPIAICCVVSALCSEAQGMNGMMDGEALRQWGTYQHHKIHAGLHNNPKVNTHMMDTRAHHAIMQDQLLREGRQQAYQAHAAKKAAKAAAQTKPVAAPPVT